VAFNWVPRQLEALPTRPAIRVWVIGLMVVVATLLTVLFTYYGPIPAIVIGLVAGVLVVLYVFDCADETVRRLEADRHEADEALKKAEREACERMLAQQAGLYEQTVREAHDARDQALRRAEDADRFLRRMTNVLTDERDAARRGERAAREEARVMREQVERDAQTLLRPTNQINILPPPPPP
jgi:hypothetical protein